MSKTLANVCEKIKDHGLETKKKKKEKWLVMDMDYGWIMVIGIDPTCWVDYGMEWFFWVIPRDDLNGIIGLLGSFCGMTRIWYLVLGGIRWSG